MKNGDVAYTCRQVRNTRKPDIIPITITLKSAEIAGQIREAAHLVGILNKRVPKPDNREKDRKGHLRKSLTQRERQKIQRRFDWYKSDRGKAHVEIQKREEESTTNQEGWLAVNLEDEDKEDYDMSFGSLNNQDTTQAQEAATYSTNLEAAAAIKTSKDRKTSKT